ncbi:MAG: hypothetical protein R2783_09605, partial [Gelidibacter sp.]
VREMAWVKPPDPTEWSRIKLKFNKPLIDDHSVSQSETYQVKNSVVEYGDSLWETFFKINLTNGQIEMGQDNPLDGLALKSHDFIKTKHHPYSKQSHKKPKITIDENFLQNMEGKHLVKKLIDKVKPEGTKLFLTSLYNKVNVSKKQLTEEIHINDFKGTGLKRSISNCVFDDKVTLINKDFNIALGFINCIFKKGFSANNIKFNAQLTFDTCMFLSGAETEASSNLMDNCSIDFHNYTTSGDLKFNECYFLGVADLTCMNIHGDLFFNACTFTFNQKHLFKIYTKTSNFSIKKTEEITFFEPKGFTHQKGSQFFTSTNAIKPFLNKNPLNENTILRLDNSSVKGNLSISNASVHENKIKCCSVIFGNLTANGIKVHGIFTLHHCLVYGFVDCTNANLEQNVEFSKAYFDYGTNDWRVVYIQNYISQYLFFQNSEIGGSLDLSCTQVGDEISLYGAKIGIYVNLFGTKCTKDLNFTFSQIKGIVAAYRHDLSLLNHHILEVGGDIDFSSCDIKNVRMEGIQLNGNLKIDSSKFNQFKMSVGLGPDEKDELIPTPSTIEGTIKVLSSEFIGDLDFSGTIFGDANSKKHNQHIVIESSSVTGDVLFFRSNLLKILDTQLEDILKARNQASIEYKRRYISKKPKTIYGNFDCRQNLIKFKAHGGNGKLQIRATTIGGKLDLRNLHLNGELNLDDSSIKLNIQMNGYHEYQDGLIETTVSGLSTNCQNISMKGLHLYGNMNLTGLKLHKFHYTGGNFEATGCEIKGGIHFIAKANGNTSIEHKEQIFYEGFVEGNFDVSVSVVQQICFTKGNFLSGIINLERTHLNKFRVVYPTPQKINLNGISVDEWDFGNEKSSKDENKKKLSEYYLGILKRMTIFDKSVYIGVEKELRNSNEDQEADKIYIAMRKKARSLNSKSWPLSKKVWDVILGVSTKYGTNFWRLLWIWLGLVTFLSLIFILFNVQVQTSESTYHLNYFEAPLFAFQNCIPLLDLKLIEGNVIHIGFKWLTLICTILSYLLLSIAIFGLSAKVSRIK